MVVAIKERACSYRHYAAVAEMSVTSSSFRPGRADVVLSVPALISRTAGCDPYGAVGGALSDGCPYPYRQIIYILILVGMHFAQPELAQPTVFTAF